MVDSFQILLFVVIVALTLIISVIGVQVFFVLREVHRIVRKLNSVTDEFKELSENTMVSLQNLTRSLGSISGLLSLADLIHKRFSDGQEKKDRKTKDG